MMVLCSLHASVEY